MDHCLLLYWTFHLEVVVFCLCPVQTSEVSRSVITAEVSLILCWYCVNCISVYCIDLYLVSMTIQGTKKQGCGKSHMHTKKITTCNMFNLGGKKHEWMHYSLVYHFTGTCNYITESSDLCGKISLRWPHLMAILGTFWYSFLISDWIIAHHKQFIAHFQTCLLYWNTSTLSQNFSHLVHSSFILWIVKHNVNRYLFFYFLEMHFCCVKENILAKFCFLFALDDISTCKILAYHSRAFLVWLF